ncbi:DUF4097 family beta strand repeat-containing protein [Sporolactobacillus kofuensis]|uniref:DUF4097 family beta strand repeat-containing protein n=1 Tax=Sporolactobacillus kofuensis TaxID=269672 RepID=A0ABW1WFQ4_9BACL|nr:DUF4097 family beta strand repeat-containing protein [Sporolactobacillus kofuensis]MCO7175835.1 DUF4097 domain-containing protein [Sporolactobacillus kofuensis]
MMKRFAVVLAIVAAAYFIFFNPIHARWLPFGKQQTSAQVTEQVEQIDIQTSSMRTKVVLGSGDQVTARLTGRGLVDVRKIGDTIQVRTQHRQPFMFWWNAPKLTITIPKSYQHQLKLAVGSATLDFHGETSQIYQKLSVNVSSGSIQLSGVASETVDASVHSGTLRIRNLRAPSAHLVVRSGNARVDRLSGAFSAQVNSGNMKIGVAALHGASSISVNSGNAQLDMPNQADFRLTAKKSSGIIQSKLRLKKEKSEDHGLSGVRGSGEYILKAQVNSGILRID